MVAMIVLLWLCLAAALIGVIAYGMRLKRLRDTPEELRGDWWSRFEAEFRDYAQRCESPGGIRRQTRSRPPHSARRRDLAEGSF
jgi:hypothetical protein